MEKLIQELSYRTHRINADCRAPHFHNGYELIYAAAGTVRIDISGVIHEITAPAVIVLNPFEWHKIISSDQDYFRYVLVADADLLEQEINPKIVATLKCRPAGFRHAIKLDRETAFFVNRIFSMLEKENSSEYAYGDKIIANEIYNLLILIYRICTTDNHTFNEGMMKIQMYIDENYQTIQSIESVAKKFFVSPEYLSRAFKNYSGYTPVEYLLNTRLYHTQILLTTTALTSVQICMNVGFRDINNFTRQFRLKYGMPPIAFRKRQLALNGR